MLSAKLSIPLLSLVLLAGCEAPPVKNLAKPESARAQDYAIPPRVERAARAGTTVTLSGKAAPQARIRLARPDGSADGATADDEGRWRASESAVTPRLISLSQDIDGRVVRARGYVYVGPHPAPPAADLRPGSGAIAFGRSGFAVLAIDLDGDGTAIVSGIAPPQAALALSIDGSEAGEGRTGVDGRFSLNAPEPLRAGDHRVRVRTAKGDAADFAFAVAPLTKVAPPFAASRRDGYTRIDWFTPGGGVQTTLLADAPGAGR